MEMWQEGFEISATNVIIISKYSLAYAVHLHGKELYHLTAVFV